MLIEEERVGFATIEESWVCMNQVVLFTQAHHKSLVKSWASNKRRESSTGHKFSFKKSQNLRKSFGENFHHIYVYWLIL
jgi:hypothetical protein